MVAHLSNRLGEVGRHEEGLATITEAIDIRRPLVAMRPAAHQAELDRSLRVRAWLDDDASGTTLT
jgi:hypothetical protein